MTPWPWFRAPRDEGFTTTFTVYEWCDVCKANVAGNPDHEKRHWGIEHPSRAARRRAARKGKRNG